MLFITTGANGTGKTLLTLKDVRELQLKTGRPVAYNGRFKMTADFGWKLIDIKNWQDEPDGTIFLVDECQYDFPLRGAGAPPDWIQRLSEHRARGFDFFLITQHVNNIDVFVRRLVGTPGWHRHMKPLGASLVVQTTWNFANGQCEKPGQGDLGERTTRAHPKDVYQWYESATLHTAKAKLPRVLIYLAVALLALPVLAYFGLKGIKGLAAGKPEVAAKSGSLFAGGAAGPGGPQGGRPGVNGVLSRDAYLVSHSPRLVGLPQTAPAYDEVTKPTIAPFPAACVQTKSKCKCWTQQGTLLPATPDALCRQIVEQGFFMDWSVASASSSSLAGVVGLGGAPRPGAAPVQVVSGGGALPGAAPGAARAASAAGGAAGGGRVLVGPMAVSMPPVVFGPSPGASPYLGDVVEDLADGEVIGHLRKGVRSW
jgi:zona occludens toxin